MDFYDKYLKYKSKYLELKLNQKGGFRIFTPKNLDDEYLLKDLNIFDKTLSYCLDKFKFNYNEMKDKNADKKILELFTLSLGVDYKDISDCFNVVNDRFYTNSSYYPNINNDEFIKLKHILFFTNDNQFATDFKESGLINNFLVDKRFEMIDYQNKTDDKYELSIFKRTEDNMLLIMVNGIFFSNYETKYIKTYTNMSEIKEDFFIPSHTGLLTIRKPFQKLLFYLGFLDLEEKKYTYFSIFNSAYYNSSKPIYNNEGTETGFTGTRITSNVCLEHILDLLIIIKALQNKKDRKYVDIYKAGLNSSFERLETITTMF